MTDLSQLNPRQQEAVLHRDGPLLVLAGAGSGKTRVLTQRIISLVSEGASPWQIFAVTFTNKAAREMKNRVVEALGPTAQSLWISTFHSSCLRILRQHGDKLGFTSQFVVYDTSEQKTVLKNIIADMGLNDKVFKPQVVAAHIDRAKNASQTPSQYPTEGDPFLIKVAAIYERYQQELLKNQAMDFGDLILNVIRLFTAHKAVLEQYQNQFKYLFIDEYQDTNPVQYQLISLLAQKHRNVFVVGDDDQSIYKFRGADVQIILNFKKDYPESGIIRLEQNYRSTRTILTAANAVIRANVNRLGKELWTGNGAGEKIRQFTAEDERGESAYVVHEITRLRAQHSLSQMAVFYRTNAQSRSFEDALRRQGIAYKIYGGMRFYDRAEIKDVGAYLRLIVNRADGLAIERVLNVPARGIGKTTLEKLKDEATRSGKTLWQVLTQLAEPGQKIVPAATASKILSFVNLLNELDAARRDLPLDEFFTHLYSKTGYWKMLTDDRSVESQSRMENLSEFVTVVEELRAGNPELTLEEFLDQVSLASDLDQADPDGEHVTLMTIHLSKGLEFDVVFLTGLEEGLFPHARSLDNEADIEEERRLCYVGVTRAKKHLYLTNAQMRHLFGTPQFNGPSRFLADVPDETKREITAKSQARPKFQASITPPPQTVHIDRSYTQEDCQFTRGQKVSHAVFGVGQLQSWEGSGDELKVSVKFQNGITKKLVFKYANLRLS